MTSSPVAAICSAWSAIAGGEGTTGGVGIDVVETKALEELIVAGGPAFVDSAWSATEQHDAEGSIERLATRWAAKEAVMKALRCGLGDLEPLDIEIHTGADGAPDVVLHGNARHAATTRGLHTWHISMCHEQGWAVAIAVAERTLTDPRHPREGTDHD